MMFRSVVALVGVLVASVATGQNAIRFGGSNEDGSTYGTRDAVYIAVTDNPGDPGETGLANDINGDMTVDWWVNCVSADNTNNAAGHVSGLNIAFTTSNIMLDRSDPNDLDENGIWGVGLGDTNADDDEFVIFTMADPDTAGRTIVGNIDVCTDTWVHIAVMHRNSDGDMWLFVDGVLDESHNGSGTPSTDIESAYDYLDGRTCATPTDACNSAPYIAVGGEAHGFDDRQYTGLMEELRISNTLRYGTDHTLDVQEFTPPTSAYSSDANTVGLFHFDESDPATTVDDASGTSDGNFEVATDTSEPSFEQSGLFDFTTGRPVYRIRVRDDE